VGAGVGVGIGDGQGDGAVPAATTGIVGVPAEPEPQATQLQGAADAIPTIASLFFTTAGFFRVTQNPGL
jgi:hypothetical protein